MTESERYYVEMLGLTEGLTNWEIDFLDNLRDNYWEDKHELSPKQKAKLEDMKEQHL